MQYSYVANSGLAMHIPQCLQLPKSVGAGNFGQKLALANCQN